MRSNGHSAASHPPNPAAEPNPNPAAEPLIPPEFSPRDRAATHVRRKPSNPIDLWSTYNQSAFNLSDNQFRDSNKILEEEPARCATAGTARLDGSFTRSIIRRSVTFITALAFWLAVSAYLPSAPPSYLQQDHFV